ncbi:hypothetical protein K2173_016669 [Erythroxylum novogranatense]|uniref:CRAL-TRIO domain-containing protein n=1 Tax=Erythroxylum novogranatense TaxID=1862640 RepID=A0AAV8SHJ3_9ROSI|nr:hypothetical protein K2173_016669 [Erythroxylum novogranatense]
MSRKIFKLNLKSLNITKITIYFIHPNLQARIFLATFGCLHFIVGRLCGKLKYINMLNYLWEHVRRKEIKVPGFVI